MNREMILLKEDADGAKLPYIEFLKGCAILSIVVFHISLCYIHHRPEILMKLTGPFSNATRVFIFASGFGLYYSHLRHPLPYRTFLRKRFVKVYLPYIAVVLVCVFVPYTYAGNDRFAAFLSHVFLYKMFIPKYNQSFGPYWFMSAIFQYYILFYVIVRMKKRIGNDRVFLAAWAGISVVWCMIVWLVPRLSETLDSVCFTFLMLHGWAFALGMLTAECLYRNHAVTITVKQLLLCLLIALITYKPAKWCSPVMIEIPLAVLILCLFTIVWALFGERLRQFMILLGSFSFEWYLTHLLLLEGMFLCIKPGNLAEEYAFAAAGLVISAFAAWAYHRLILFLRTGRMHRPASGMER